MMIYKTLVVLAMLCLPILAPSQNGNTYESKLLKTDRLTIEYMDFGGDGAPLIVVQGVHNYFDESATQPWIKYENTSWLNLFGSFTNDFEVVAPLKRGFGKTDSQLEEENVMTLTQDLISFLDKMKIENAFFMGRDTSAQIMLNLAENFPERISGLIFIDPRFVFTEVKDKATEEFMFYSYSESYNESEFKNYKMKKSELYRPSIYKDTTKSIEVPALLFYNTFFSTTTVEYRRIENFIKWVDNDSNIDWSKEYSTKDRVNYFEALSKDKKRMSSIRDYLQLNNPTPKMYDALKSAFGDNLVIFNETNMKIQDVNAALTKVYAPVINAFLAMSN